MHRNIAIQNKFSHTTNINACIHTYSHSICIKNCIATQQNTGLLLIQSFNIACVLGKNQLYFSFLSILNISESRPRFKELGLAEVKVSEVAIQNTLWKHL